MSLDLSLHYRLDDNEVSVFSANITHNLGSMAKACNLYDSLWHGAEKHKTAGTMVQYLIEGLHDLRSRPEYFKQFNPPNEWGDYKGFVKVVEEILEACKQYPSALITCSR